MQIPYQVIRMADENYAVMPYVSQIDYSYLAKELCKEGISRVLAVFGYTCLSFSERGMDVFLGQQELTCVASFLYAQHQKKEFDIILGNIIGTNIFNIGFVLGLPVLILGGVSSIEFQLIDMVLIVLSGIVIYTFAKDDRVISKKEGLIMLAVFLEYYLYVIITGL